MEDREVIQVSEQNALIDWIKKNVSEINYSNMHKYISCSDISDIAISDLIKSIKNRIIEKEHLEDAVDGEEILKDFLYVSNPGTRLHYHIDDCTSYMNNTKFKNKVMIRFNICIQKPENGGRPIYSGNLIELVERHYVICLSGIEYHTSEWISGNVSKINLSLGFMIDSENLHKYTKRENIIQESLNIMSWLNPINDLEDDKKFDSIVNNLVTEEHYKLNDNSENGLEKYMLKILKYHNIDINDKYSDYSLTNSKISIDYHKSKNEYSLYTVIIFLKDTCCPFLISSVDNETYKYKEILEENNVSFYKAKKYNHIIVDSSKYYGFIEDSDLCIKIRVWKISPHYSVTNSVMLLDNNIDIENIADPVENNVFVYSKLYNNSNILSSILYDKNNSVISYIKDSVNGYDETINTFLFKTLKNNCLDYVTFLEKYGSLSEDLYPIIYTKNWNNETPITPSNRFYRNKLLKNVLSLDVCYWILNETIRKDEWTHMKYDNYYNSLNIELIPSVFNFVLFICNFWFTDIKKVYNIENIDFNITSIFISKFVKEHKNNIQNIDGSCLTINLILNNSTDYIGGELYFENTKDNLRVNQGDMICFNGVTPYSHYDISEGEKFVLVIMVDFK